MAAGRNPNAQRYQALATTTPPVANPSGQPASALDKSSSLRLNTPRCPGRQNTSEPSTQVGTAPTLLRIASQRGKI